MTKNSQKTRRATRVRKKLQKNPGRPRLTVFRSNRYIWAQIVDDKHGLTLATANSKTLKATKAKATKTDLAFAVGQALAKKAQKNNIKTVQFDRGLYRYHGQVKALADGARLGGLIF